MPRMRIGEVLVQKKIITQEQLDIALAKQKKEGDFLGMVLVKLGFINDESDLLPFIAEQQGVNYIRLKRLDIPLDVVSRIPAKLAIQYKLVPVYFQYGVLTIAMTKPCDIILRDEISMLVDADIDTVLASRVDIETAIKKYYGLGVDTIEEIMTTKGGPVSGEDIEVQDIDKIESEATISSFFNQVLLDAYNCRATDIHIEPYDGRLIIRYRVDGILRSVNIPPSINKFRNTINSRIKIMSSLNIAERRRPQDGRFRIRIANIELDLRISFLPTPYGESVVIRILNTSKLMALEELDLAQNERDLIMELINRPHGIIFLTGPTGSGKTTTLYSCLSKINTVDKKIITIEDPIEYQLDGITQIQVNPQIDLTFANGLRSILRHDPEVIMVGEVRDMDTLDITTRSALTGHLIFSTLHTQDAASGITRLLNMGVEPYLITTTVECFIAQRLIRLCCPKCKHPKKINLKQLRDFHDYAKGDEEIVIHEGKGCDYCNHTGYYGRTAIFEFLVMTDEICGLILDNAGVDKIRERGFSSGMRSLRAAGWDKVVAGLTTPEEVMRVTQQRMSRAYRGASA